MNKHNLLNIIIIAISILLWFMPEEPFYCAWSFSIRVFFEAMAMQSLFSIEFLRELLTIAFGTLSVVLCAINVVKHSAITRSLSTAASFAYVAVWFANIFVEYPYRTPIWTLFSRDVKSLWLVLYFAMLLTIVALSIVQFSNKFRPKSEGDDAQ